MKIFLLVRSEILGVFVHTMTADGKHSRHNRESLRLSVQMQLWKNHKTFCQNFIASLNSTWKLEHLKKNMNLIRKYFSNCWLWKTWLLKGLKDHFSEYPLAVSELTGPKHCSNLYGGTFILFIRQSETNWVGKIFY